MFLRLSSAIALASLALTPSAAASELRLVVVTGQALPDSGGGTLEQIPAAGLTDNGLVVVHTRVLNGDEEGISWLWSDDQLVRMIADGDPLPGAQDNYAGPLTGMQSIHADASGNFLHVVSRNLYKLGLTQNERLAQGADACPAPYDSDAFSNFYSWDSLESGWVIDTECDGVIASFGSGLEFLVHDMSTMPLGGESVAIRQSALQYLSATRSGAWVSARTDCATNNPNVPCLNSGGGGFYVVEGAGPRLLVTRGSEDSGGNVLDWDNVGRTGTPDAWANPSGTAALLRIGVFVPAPVADYASTLYVSDGGVLTRIAQEGDGNLIRYHNLPLSQDPRQWFVADDGSVVINGRFDLGGSDTACIARHRNGSWTRLVCAGEPLPEQPGSRITTVGRLEANASGELAIEVIIDGPDCPANKVCRALLYDDGQGELSLVAAPGLLFDNGTVVHVMDGLIDRQWDGSWFNERGEMLFMSYHLNNSDPALFVAIPDAPEIDEEEGSIRVQLSSSQPLATPDDVEVSRFTAILYKQSGGIRAQTTQETDEAYTAYIKRERATWQRLASVQYGSGANGLAVFDAVATKELAQIGPLQIERWSRFAVEITDASVEELTDPADPSQGTTTLHYVGETIYNLKPDFVPPFEITEQQLDPLPPVGIKQDLIANLIDLSPGNYASTELLVQDWLQNTYLVNPGAVTPAQAQALRRAINAERIVHTAAVDSKVLIDLMLGGVANIAGDLWDELVGTKNDAISKRIGQRDALRQGALTASAFNNGQNIDLGNYVDDIELDQNVFLSEIAELINKGLKTLKPGIVYAATALGADPSRTEYIADVLPKIIQVVIARLAGGNWQSVLKAGAKIIIEETVALFADPLFDRPNDAQSYCGSTEPSLQSSLTRATNWNMSDPVAFEADNIAFFNHWRTFNDRTQATMEGTILIQAAAEAADITADFLSLVGKFNKAASFIAKIAELLKVLGNFGGVIVPGVHVFNTAPDMVQDGVDKAYGN